MLCLSNRAAYCPRSPRRQINVGKLHPVTGKFTGESDVYALAGYLRGRVRNMIGLHWLVTQYEYVVYYCEYATTPSS